MSWRKRIRKIGHKFEVQVRKVAQKAHRIETKVGKVAIPVVTAFVSYEAGPVVGEAFAYGATRAQYAIGKSGERSRGIHGHQASINARKIANRTFKYSQAAVGAGSLAAGVVALASGASVTSALGNVAAGASGAKALGIPSGAEAPSTVKEFGDLPLTQYGGGGGLNDQGPTQEMGGIAPHGTSTDEFGNPISLADQNRGATMPKASTSSTSGDGFWSKFFGAAPAAEKALLGGDQKKPGGQAAAELLGAIKNVPRWVWLALVIVIVLANLKSEG